MSSSTLPVASSQRISTPLALGAGQLRSRGRLPLPPQHADAFVGECLRSRSLGAPLVAASRTCGLRPPRGGAVVVRAGHSPNELRSNSMDATQLTTWVNALMPWPCSEQDIGNVVVPPPGPQGPVVCLDTVFLDLVHLHEAVKTFFASHPDVESAAAVRALSTSRIAAANTWLTTSTSLTGPADIMDAEAFSRVSGGGRVARRKKAMLLAIAACEKAIETECAKPATPGAKPRTDSPAERLHAWACGDQGLRARFGSAIGHPNGDERAQAILEMMSIVRGLFDTCRQFMATEAAQGHGPGIAAFMRQQMHGYNAMIEPWHDLTTHPSGIGVLLMAVQMQRSIELHIARW